MSREIHFYTTRSPGWNFSKLEFQKKIDFWFTKKKKKNVQYKNRYNHRFRFRGNEFLPKIGKQFWLEHVQNSILDTAGILVKIYNNFIFVEIFKIKILRKIDKKNDFE